MTEAKLAPNLPQWMVDHTHRYLESGGNPEILRTSLNMVITGNPGAASRTAIGTFGVRVSTRSTPTR